jgi:hypothetical protein
MGRECGMQGGQVVGFRLGILEERATGRKWANSVKCHVNRRESELKGVKLIHLAQDRGKRLALVEHCDGHSCSVKCGEFLDQLGNVSFTRMILQR